MIIVRSVVGICIVATIMLGTIVRADVITENFTYDDQIDSIGLLRITTDATTDGPGVVEFSEGRSTSASIVSNSAYFNTSSGTGISDEFLGIVDIPGFTGPFGGEFGAFFATSQNLTDSFGSVEVAHTMGTNSARFRLLAEDQSGNEIATSDFALSSTLTTFNYVAADFVILVSGSTFDETNVTNVAIEFFAAPASGNMDAMQFQVDSFQLTTIPEPASLILVSGIGAIMALRRRRV